jgi:signal transduction histidine kinase
VVKNAVEAMPNGGTLRLRLEQYGSQAQLLIADTGAGIPEEGREKIFELYYTTKQGGSGLGLPMAFRAVQLHGGTMDLESEPNRGTTFRIHLPLDTRNDVTAV